MSSAVPQRPLQLQSGVGQTQPGDEWGGLDSSGGSYNRHSWGLQHPAKPVTVTAAHTAQYQLKSLREERNQQVTTCKQSISDQLTGMFWNEEVEEGKYECSINQVVFVITSWIGIIVLPFAVMTSLWSSCLPLSPSLTRSCPPASQTGTSSWPTVLPAMSPAGGDSPVSE